MKYILIPAYNAGDTINEVINRCYESVPDAKILVMDDGSNDDTVVKISTGKRRPDKLYIQARNFGKGVALRDMWKILSWTEEIRRDDIIIQIDSDLQHNPEDIPILIEEMLENDLDCIVGERDLSSYPFHKKIGNYFLSKWSSLFAGIDIKDSESGFRIMNWGLVFDLLKVCSATRYAIEIEMNVAIGLLGYRLGYKKVDSPIYTGRGVGIRAGIQNAIYAVKLWMKEKTKWETW